MSDPSVAALAERVARMEDEREVVATLYTYGHALDYGDRGGFLDCFTPDADYVVEMRLGAEGNFRFHGHDELGAYFDGHTHAPDAWHKHVTVNPSVRPPATPATRDELLPPRRRRADERPHDRPRVRSLHRRARPRPTTASGASARGGARSRTSDPADAEFTRA